MKIEKESQFRKRKENCLKRVRGGTHEERTKFLNFNQIRIETNPIASAADQTGWCQHLSSGKPQEIPAAS